MQPVRHRLRTYLAAGLLLGAALFQPFATRAAGPHTTGPFVKPQF